MFKWKQAISKMYMEIQRNTNSQDTIKEQERGLAPDKVTVNKVTWYCDEERQIEQ